jgi:hypothetical protein
MRWFYREDNNIAVVAGGISDGMVILDMDHCPKAPGMIVWCQKHNIPKTWTTRTARGWHIHLRVDDLPTANYVRDGVEIIVNGSGIIPPSTHPSGVQYAEFTPWGVKVARVKDLEELGLAQEAAANAAAHPSKRKTVGAPEAQSSSDECAHDFPFDGCGRVAPPWLYDFRVLIPKIKEQVEIPSLLLSMGAPVSLTRRGTVDMGVCPFHADTAASFAYDARHNTCRCYGTGCIFSRPRWMDSLDVYQLLNNVDLADAIRALSKEVE